MVMILPQVHLRNGLTSPKFPKGPDYILSRAYGSTHFHLVCERSPCFDLLDKQQGLRCGSSISPEDSGSSLPLLPYPVVSHGPPASFLDWFGVKGFRNSPSIRKCRQLSDADLHEADYCLESLSLLFPAAKASASVYAKDQPCYDFYFL